MFNDHITDVLTSVSTEGRRLYHDETVEDVHKESECTMLCIFPKETLHPSPLCAVRAEYFRDV